jgi:hypothetical protein
MVNTQPIIVYLSCVPYLKEIISFTDEPYACGPEHIIQTIRYYSYPGHIEVTDEELIQDLDENALLVGCDD